MMTLRDWMQDRRVAAALAAVAVLAVVYRFIPEGGGKTPPAPPPGAEGKPQPQETSGGAVASTAPAVAGGGSERVASASKALAWSWGRNPFLPQWKERRAEGIGGARTGSGTGGEGEFPGGAGEPSMGLRGTVISGNSGIAIFGNRLVPVGGRLGDWTVERVDPYSVALRSGKEVRVVELYKPAPSGGKGRGGDR